jgi:NADPH:quinone reductase-like Zn-dependent oxidoreductase
MRAIVAERFGGYQDLKLADIPEPVVSNGRILVRITASGVTPLDHTILSGGHPRAKAPLVLGNEGAGVVVVLRSETHNQRGEAVLVLTAKLVVPRKLQASASPSNSTRDDVVAATDAHECDAHSLPGDRHE